MKSPTRILIDTKMSMLGFERGLKELAERTGIKYLRLQEHIKEPGSFRLFEIQAIIEVLKFNDEETLRFVRGE